jgi:folate-binding protein YgfZ
VTSAAPDLHTTLAAVPITLSVVTVDGPDAEAYLQGQLSQDIASLAAGDTAPALLLQPTGKLTAWLRVQRTGPAAFALVIDGSNADDVVARLQRFKLRTDATIELTERAALAVRGPGASDVRGADPDVLRVPAGWPGLDGVDLIAPLGAARPTVDLPSSDHAALDAARIEAGVPRMGAELSETTIPAEGGQWLIDASVSFTKGCYTGQELVARIDSRGGNVPRPVRGLRIAGDDTAGLVGASVFAGGAEVGVLTSVGRSSVLGTVALAPLARSVEDGAVLSIATDTGEREATVVAVPMR